MDIATILREIDAEIGKLRKAREILKQCIGPPTRLRRKYVKKKALRQKPERSAAAVFEPVVAEIQVTVIPPKQKREYQRRPKAIYRETRALDAAISETPVAVPRAAIARPSERPAREASELEAGKLEAAIRRSLLGDSGSSCPADVNCR